MSFISPSASDIAASAPREASLTDSDGRNVDNHFDSFLNLKKKKKKLHMWLF